MAGELVSVNRCRANCMGMIEDAPDKQPQTFGKAMEWGLPPGFRFHPTDEELVGYYLKRKLEGLEFELQLIPLVDLYKFDPWELPEKSLLPSRDLEWFFFCPRDRKYPNGLRTNRATKVGYWKATGKDRKVVCQSLVTGYRKTLVFYKGRAPFGDRTNWMMHEYRLSDDSPQGSTNFQGDFAVCRVIKKSEISQSKTKMVMDVSDVSCEASYQYNGSRNSSPIPFAGESFWVSPAMILDSSKVCEHPCSTGSWQTYNPFEISPCSSLSNVIGEVELGGGISHDFMEYDGLHDNYYDRVSQIGGVSDLFLIGQII